jgi:uncharacterized integral membrane protein
MSRRRLVAPALGGILAILVVVQNTQAVETKLLFVTATMPSAVPLFVTLVIGFVIGVLAAGRISGKLAPKAGTSHRACRGWK